jgi:hypothetical protein
MASSLVYWQENNIIYNTTAIWRIFYACAALLLVNRPIKFVQKLRYYKFFVNVAPNFAALNINPYPLLTI